MTIGERIKTERTKKGLSQAALGEILQITQQAVGKWEKNLAEPDSETLIKLSDIFDISIAELLGREEKSPSVRKGVWINVYGHIAAGIPIEAIEDIVDREELSEEMLKHGEYIALRVKGDSMEPKISDGDTVIIRIQETIESGEIAAVYVNGNDVTLKRVRIEENGIWLIGNNPAFTPMFYSKQQCADLPVRILGKMVELRAKF